MLRREEPWAGELLSLALEASGSGIWDWDVATGKVTWSPRTAELFGREPGSFGGTYEAFLESVHPEDREAVVAVLEKAREDRNQYHHELRIVRADGSIRWVACHGRFLYDKEGRPVRLAGMVQDVTARKASDESVHRDREAAERRSIRLKLLSDTAAELLSSELPRDLMESIFRRISSHLGLEVYFYYRLREGRLTLSSCAGVPEEALSSLQIVEVGQDVCGTAAATMGPIAVQDVQASRSAKTARVRALGITAYACFPLIARGRLLGTLSFGTRLRQGFEPDDLDLMLTLCNQMASAVERSRLLEELRRSSREAEEARGIAEAASRTKDEFLAALSHELRTPLTPVLLTARALASDQRIPAELRRDVERVRRNVELEARLIDDLLDLTRIARGKTELHSEVVDLHALLREVAETCAGRAPRTPRLELHLSPSPCRIWGDAARLQQVFLNLLGNAIKFTPSDGVVSVSTMTAEGRVEIEVRDTGEGIDSEVLPHIFNAFEQGGVHMTRRFGGLGLGLAISRSLVDLHGGSIEAASPGIGQGAAFTVTLPIVEAPLAGPEPEPGADRQADRPLHILLVEDHADTAEAMADLLRARGYRVTVALSKAAALAAAEAAAAGGELPFDIVVSDLGLPDGSGLDLMRELAGRYGLSGIAVSGYGMEEDLRRSREAGFADHLTKPFDLGRLEAALQRVVAGARRTGAHA